MTRLGVLLPKLRLPKSGDFTNYVAESYSFLTFAAC